MISKVIVSPGAPRSGTTYLYTQLSGQNREFFNVLPKETNFFQKRRSSDELKAKIPEGYVDEKYCIDFSPAYFISRDNWIENLIKFQASEKKIFIHLRNPVDQIFAHYLHDIISHWAKRQYGDDVDRPFFRINTLSRYLAKRAGVVQRMVAEFGRESVLAINFHRDISAPMETTRRVSEFLRLPLKPFSNLVVGLGGWTPHYIYGGQEGLNIPIGSQIRRIPARSLLLVNCKESMIWHNVDEDTSAKIISGSSSWTKEINPEQFHMMYEFLREDWLTILESLGEEEEDYKVESYLRSRPPFVGDEVIADLPLQAEIRAILPKSCFTLYN